MIRLRFLLPIALLLAHTALSQPAKGKSSKPKPGNDDAMWVVPPAQELPAGVSHHRLRSQAMDREVGFCVYLPPGYDRHPERRYPVLYHLHGAGGNETRSLFTATVLHEGIVAGRLPELIVVFPNGGRATMYQDSGDGRFRAETWMIRELIPHIDATYRTIADRKARCIEGFSMGGRGATHLAMKYPELFGSLFNQSGNVYHVSAPELLPNAYLGDDPQRLRTNDPYLNLAKNLEFIRANLRIQLACGTADPDHLTTVREFHAALDVAGVKHDYFEVEGLGHNQKQMLKSPH
jgi:enterochelin esterase-like enzyme